MSVRVIEILLYCVMSSKDWEHSQEMTQSIRSNYCSNNVFII